MAIVGGEAVVILNKMYKIFCRRKGEMKRLYLHDKLVNLSVFLSSAWDWNDFIDDD